MAGLTTSINNTLQRWAGASSSVVQAISGASKRTGVSFDYLMNKAKQESSFQADAKASTSSATGLFQFIDSTWLQAVKSHGSQFGLGDLSSKISNDGGKLTVSDAATKQKILALRNDPTTASNMVAAMTKDNESFLHSSLGGPVGENDLYLAHFLGLGGADKFLHARQNDPSQSAAALFPAAASANKNVFYDQSGKARSLDGVYDYFAQKFDGNAGAVVATGSGSSDTSSVASINPTATASSKAFAAINNLPSPGLSLSSDVASSQGLTLQHWGNNQILEMLTSGLTNYGTKDTQNKMGKNLISPYTSLVLAQLRSPGEAQKINADASGGLLA